MSYRIGGLVVIEDEKPQQCDDCGKLAELRPYGPGGSCICIECAHKDPEGTDRRMDEKLFGVILTRPDAGEEMSNEQ